MLQASCQNLAKSAISATIWQVINFQETACQGSESKSLRVSESVAASNVAHLVTHYLLSTSYREVRHAASILPEPGKICQICHNLAGD
jgi:hypothetical protein